MCWWMYIAFIDSAPITTGFTNGAGQIWLSNVNCLGTEHRVVDCRADPFGQNTCVHEQDAGVRCSTVTVDPGEPKHNSGV